jgi:glucose-1-phosphate cytidylyltransferase
MKLTKVIILAGGKGLRIYSEKNSLTKPLAKINGKPLIWYVINTYLKNGLNSFIVCTGANTKAINSLFKNFNILFKDLKKKNIGKNHYSFQDKKKKWDLRIINTGTNTMTGGRIRRVKKYLENEENFCVSYCDTISDINIQKQIDLHISKKKIATLAAVSVPDRFGLLKIVKSKILSFTEKPKKKDKKINGGFFVFNKKIFNYISDDQTVLEESTLSVLAKKRQLIAFMHHGFWQCVDNLKDQSFVSKYLKNKRNDKAK